MVICHLVYILTTGTTSTAWDSALELLVLALQSRRPQHLANTSVGVEKMATFRELVGIRANLDDELEFVFANDRDVLKDVRNGKLQKVVRNKAY